MNRIELMMRRRAVAAFIKADPVLVELTRNNDPVTTSSGGKKAVAASILPPQEARIVPNRRRYNNGIVNSEAGDIPHTDYLLLANFNKDFQKEDSFVWMGEHYKITGVHQARTESILCSIDLLGPENR